MNTSKVEICGVNTALLPVLNEEQKTQLLLAAKAGSSEARAQMIQGNLRLVLSVVQKFAGRGENLDDLFQVGCIGLIKAIDNFDPGLNVRFSTYGVPMILGEIRRFCGTTPRCGSADQCGTWPTTPCRHGKPCKKKPGASRA